MPLLSSRFCRRIHVTPLVSLIVLLVAGPLRGQSPASSRPNIVFILADDMGWGDVSRYACADFTTPNIDRIATQGVQLMHACAWPVCSPSRAALLTGMDPKRVGVPAVLMPGAVGINTNCYTMAEHFRRSGYATALIGKWHLGYTNQALPQARGFETYFGFHGGQINYTNFYYSSEGTYDLWDGSTNVADVYFGQYTTRIFTDKAKDYITAHTNTPFFLYLAYNAPHYPLYAPKNYTDRFTNSIPYGNRRTFAGMVAAMDDGIGEILDLLAARGLSSNTLVWFMTDNGALTSQGGVNAPLSGEKATLGEGGIRLPCVVAWPGRLPSGTRMDALFSIVDVFPTLASATGERIPPSLRLDGIDQWGVLRNPSQVSTRTLVVFNDGNYSARAAISNDWKLLNTNGTARLVDLAADLSETNDLAAGNPALVSKLESVASNQWESLKQGIYRTNQPPEILRFNPSRR